MEYVAEFFLTPYESSVAAVLISLGDNGLNRAIGPIGSPLEPIFCSVLRC